MSCGVNQSYIRDKYISYQFKSSVNTGCPFVLQDQCFGLYRSRYLHSCRRDRSSYLHLRFASIHRKVFFLGLRIAVGHARVVLHTCVPQELPKDLSDAPRELLADRAWALQESLMGLSAA